MKHTHGQDQDQEQEQLCTLQEALVSGFDVSYSKILRRFLYDQLKPMWMNAVKEVKATAPSVLTGKALIKAFKHDGSGMTKIIFTDGTYKKYPAIPIDKAHEFMHEHGKKAMEKLRWKSNQLRIEFDVLDQALSREGDGVIENGDYENNSGVFEI